MSPVQILTIPALPPPLEASNSACVVVYRVFCVARIFQDTIYNMLESLLDEKFPSFLGLLSSYRSLNVMFCVL